MKVRSEQLKSESFTFQIDKEFLHFIKMLRLRLLKGKNGYTDYVRCRFIGDNKTYLLHRLVMMAEPEDIVDHINGDGLDNRKCNLRIVNSQINNGNARIRKDNSTGVKGCHWNKKLNKFSVRLQIDGQRYYIGHFNCIEDAKYAYEEAYYNHYGRFPR